MKKLIPLILIFVMASAAVGEVSTRVCEADGNTPFNDRPIMVGTKLKIIVSSDANSIDPYAVDLTIEGTDRDYGLLSAPVCLDAAGEGAWWYPWNDDLHQGFCFQTDENAEAGDWFTVDYNATKIGDCNVVFYDNFVPAYEIPFTHVRTRDFNKDTIVNFEDYAVLGSHWLETDCGDCGGADLTDDNDVDTYDLKLFTDYWLEKTE